MVIFEPDFCRWHQTLEKTAGKVPNLGTCAANGGIYDAVGVNFFVRAEESAKNGLFVHIYKGRL